jgi:hypothetical protein
MTTAAWATIKGTFEKKFAAWSLVLPVESLSAPARGSIHKNGWTINYRYGAEQGEEYLEYFASHRMTNDTLNRIYADGREELVGYCQEFYEVGNEQAKQAYYEHNRKFYEDVKHRGLQ